VVRVGDDGEPGDVGLVAVDHVHQREVLSGEDLEGGEGEGEPAQAALQAGRHRADDVGVEPYPGHTREPALDALRVRGDAEVYPNSFAVQDTLASPLHVERQPELLCQHVRRAERQDP
jgi:hypothetical protein